MSEDPENVVRLTSTPHEMQSSIIAGTLRENGIHSTITGQHTSGFRAEAPGWVQVLVAEEDLPRAREILKQLLRENQEIDWSEVDVGDPEGEE